MSARILAVEDTASLRALLQLCLTRGGYQVDISEDGRSAVEMFRAGGYDAVVMDIQMPVLDGLAAVALMRDCERAEKRAPVPILALTANTEPSDLKRCLEAGFTATVRKPFGREELLAAVAKRLSEMPEPGGRIVVNADPEFADLIPQFLANARRESEAMRGAVEVGDFRLIAASSHKLTGAGASFGFPPLSEEARRVELAAKAGDAAGVSRHLEALRVYLDRVSVVYP